MAFTLQNLLVETYKKLGQLNVSVATGGSTTTIIDSKQADQHGDDSFKLGVVFILRDSAGASAAPEGEMAIVDTSYTDSTGTFTWATAMTAAPASGDTYGFANNFYPYHTMIELCNAAMQSLGDIPLTDITTLDTAASKTEYTYAVDWKLSPPYRIDVQTKLSDADNFLWREIYDWEYVPATAGSTGLIVLPQLSASRDLRVWYKSVHPVLSVATSVIYEGFDPELVTLSATERALEWQNSRLQGGDDFLMQRWNDAKMQLAQKKSLATTWRPRTSPKLLIVGPYSEEDKFTHPEAP